MLTKPLSLRFSSVFNTLFNTALRFTSSAEPTEGNWPQPYMAASPASFISLFAVIALAGIGVLPAKVLAASCNAPANCDQTYAGGTSSGLGHLNSGQTLCVTGGEYTGSASLPSGSSLYIANGASFNPSNFNNPAGTLTNCGTLRLPPVSLMAGFVLHNHGTANLANSINWNGAATLVNSDGATLNITSSFGLKNGSSFTNNGTVKSTGVFETDSGTTLINNAHIELSGGNFNPNGTVLNAGFIQTDEFININTNAQITNNCTLITRKGFNNNSNSTLNNGYIFVTGMDASNDLLQINQAFKQGPNGFAVGIDFFNLSAISGGGNFYFTGDTRNQGSLGTDSGGINFYDASPTGNQIMDVQSPVPHASVTNTIITPPAITDIAPNCTALVGGVIDDDDKDLIPNNQDTRTSTPFSCTGNLYMVNNGQLNTFNPITTLFEPIGSNTTSVNGIGYNTSNQLAYGIYRSDLYLMDATGSTEFIGAVSPKGGSQPVGFPNELRSGVMVGNALWGLSRSYLNHAFKIDVAARTYEAIELDTAFTNGTAIPGDITYFNDHLYSVNRGLVITLDISQIPITKNTAVLGNDLIGDVFAGGQMMDGAGNLFATSNNGGFYQVLNYTTASPSLLYLSASPTGNQNDAFNCAISQCSTLDFDCDNAILTGDIDQDNDGITDRAESNGINPLADDDGNGIPNFQDAASNGSANAPNCSDANNDTICDQLDILFDADEDGLPNHLDKDSDNDGLPDSLENHSQSLDTNADGTISIREAGGTTNANSFGDNGFANTLELDDTLNASAIKAPQDTDNDGTPNFLDTDSDNDGISDLIELNSTVLLALDADNNGQIDNTHPVGNDGIADSAQSGIDASPVNHPPVDTDSDGISNDRDDDSDNDGLLDRLEHNNAAKNGTNNLDTDKDGIADYLDLDSDNDGLPDNIEAQASHNYIAPQTGTDNIAINGRNNAYRALPTGLTPTNTDGDALPDYLDTDSDNDTFSDTTEAALLLSPDVGNNGLNNAVESTDNYNDVNGNINTPLQLPNIDGVGDINVREANPASITIHVVAGDDTINTQEDDSPIILSGSTRNVEDGQTVTLTLNGQSYSATVSNNAWQTTLPASAAQALGAGHTITAEVSNSAGSTASPATRPISHTTMPPTITINVIAGDDIINSTEDNNPVRLTGTTQYVESGQAVSLLLNGQTYSATVNNDQWQSAVPAADAQQLAASNTLIANVSNTAGDAAQPATRSIRHSTTQPAITINVVADDDIINNTEDDGPITLSGTTTDVEDGQSVTLSFNGQTYTATVSNNQWQTPLPATDAQQLAAINTLRATVSNTAGDAAQPVTRTITHSTTQPTVTINTVAGDDAINNTEHNSPVILSGTTTDVEDGQNVTLNLNGQRYSATVNNNQWQTLLPATDAQQLAASNTLSATVSNTAGDAALPATRSIRHDIVLPTITINLVAGDDVINNMEADAPVVISGTTTGIEDGQTITLHLNNQSYTAIASHNQWQTYLPAARASQLGATNTLTADVSNIAGNAAQQANRTVTYQNLDLNDDDKDGIPNGIEGTDDFDGDNIPNHQDPDSDNDGVPDNLEGASGNDENNNGIDDAFDNGHLPVDSDGDGSPDFLDTDSDNDGLPDAIEQGNGNTLIDTDGDTIADFRDIDSDGDRLPDSWEVNGDPLMPPDEDQDGAPNHLDADSDGDSIADTIEAGLPAPSGQDTNSNGLDDSLEAVFTGGEDTNNDGIDDLAAPTNTDNDEQPDYLDADSDNDGISDDIENSLNNTQPPTLTLQDTDNDGIIDTLDIDQNPDATDSNNNGIVDSLEPTDTDGDGIPDYQDTDSDNDSISDQIETNTDTDGDDQPNYRDLDSDDDGLSDSSEAGLSINPDTGAIEGNPRQSDGDGTPDYLDQDSDNDGLLDNTEAGGNNNANGTQRDTDGDSIPDYRDLDADNDGISDANEIAWLNQGDADNDGLNDAFDADANGDGIIDTGKSDIDADGINDTVDADINGIRQPDLDNNGIIDAANQSDFDGDGIPDTLDIDSDNDGLPDLDEAGGFYRDTNGNGRINGADINENGLADSVDEALGGTPLIPIDTDGDGLPDTRDLDSDGDGLTDLVEAGLSNIDPNGDGLVGTGSFADNNSNGLGDLADPTNGGQRAQFIDRDYDGLPDNRDLDSDGDGISDLTEAVGPVLADTLDPGLDGRIGSALTPSEDANNNGISDVLEGGNHSLDARAREDNNNNGISDVAEQYLTRIQVQPPSQPANPATGQVDPAKADFDRDGYPDVIEVRYGGDPLNGAEDDDNGNGVPNWVENTDTNGDGNNDSDADGFADLLEQVIGTNPEQAEPIDTLFDAAMAQLLNNPRYQGRAPSPVIWVDMQQSASYVINIARLAGGALLTGRIGNYHVFGDARDPAATPTYQWSFPNPALDAVVIGNRNSAKLVFNPEPLTAGVYSAILSISLGGHTSVTQQLISIVDGSAQHDSDKDQLTNHLDRFNANLGYLHHAQTNTQHTFDADSPVFVGIANNFNFDDPIDFDNIMDGNHSSFENMWFSDQAIRVRIGQLGLSAQTLHGPLLTIEEGAATTVLTSNQLNTTVSTLRQNTIAPAASSIDEGYNTGAIYDFEIINLPYPGAQARVTIALTVPIEQGAQARHYSLLKGWQAFVTDTHNQIASGPHLNGSEHLCPPIGSNAYTPNLTPGHLCVQLTLLDGGLNDADNNELAAQEDGQGDVNGLIAHTLSLAKPNAVSANSSAPLSSNSSDAPSSNASTSSTAYIPPSQNTSSASSAQGRIETGVKGGALHWSYVLLLLGLIGLHITLKQKRAAIRVTQSSSPTATHQYVIK